MRTLLRISALRQKRLTLLTHEACIEKELLPLEPRDHLWSTPSPILLNRLQQAHPIFCSSQALKDRLAVFDPVLIEERNRALRLRIQELQGEIVELKEGKYEEAVQLQHHSFQVRDSFASHSVLHMFDSYSFWSEDLL